MILSDWRIRAINDGRGFHVDVGAFSTPIAGAGEQGTVIDIDQPSLSISVPEGTSIIPTRVDVSVHVPLLATDIDECEILCAADIASANAGDGTYTTETPVNMKTRHTRTSVCTCHSAFTADTTDPVLGLELIRSIITGDLQSAAGVMWTPFKLLYIPTYPPILDGPCALYLYWGGTVQVSAFAQMEWLEYPSNSLTRT